MRTAIDPRRAQSRAVAIRRWRWHVPKSPSTPHTKVRIEFFKAKQWCVVCVSFSVNYSIVIEAVFILGASNR